MKASNCTGLSDIVSKVECIHRSDSGGLRVGSALQAAGILLWGYVSVSLGTPGTGNLSCHLLAHRAEHSLTAPHVCSAPLPVEQLSESSN